MRVKVDTAFMALHLPSYVQDAGMSLVVGMTALFNMLKLNIEEYWEEREIPEHDFPVGFSLTEPDIKFAELAQSLGVAGVRVETRDQIGPAIQQALSHDGPFLIDLVIANQVKGTRTIAGADKA